MMKSADHLMFAAALAFAAPAMAQEVGEEYTVYEGVTIQESESNVAFGAGIGRAYAREYRLCPSDAGRAQLGAPTLEELVLPMRAADMEDGVIDQTVLGIAYGCRDELSVMNGELVRAIRRDTVDTVE